MKLFYLFRLGVTEGMDSETRRVVVLSNGVYLTIAILIAVYFAAFLPFRPSFSGFSSWVPVIVGGVAILSLLLNHNRYYVFSKTIFFLMWINFVVILPPVISGAREESYILHPFYGIISSVIVHLIFSYQKEKFFYLTFLFLTWTLIVGSVDWISFNLGPDSGPPKIFVNGFFRWRVMTFMFATFFNITMIYVLQINHRFYSRLLLQHATILEQNITLEIQRKELELLTNQLEGKVALGTELVKKQNEQITEYSFFNSHILRAPVSRIRGLLQLLSHNLSPEEDAKIRSLLAESMIELDNAIKSINDKLQDQ